MQAEIACLSDAGVPRSLTELITLGRTLKRRAGDILAYFDHPHTSNGPTEAINGRLGHQRGCPFRVLVCFFARLADRCWRGRRAPPPGRRGGNHLGAAPHELTHPSG